MASEKRLPDRHIVYCLRCCKPQEKISVHLTKACMKESTREEVEVEVRKAKASTKEWLRNGRRIDYLDLLKRFPHRECRHTLTRMLVELGFFVSNMPQESDMEPVSRAQDPDIRNADAAASTSAATTSGEAGPQNLLDLNEGSSTSSSSSDHDNGTSDPSWQKDLPAATTSVRVKMKEAGLYKKFDENSKLLVDFKKYLQTTLRVPNCQQEVDNVSRFVRYLQPTGEEPSLTFLNKSQQTRDYIESLRNAKLSASTILNYIKNMIRFIGFLKIRLDLVDEDRDLHRKLEYFKEFLQTMRKPVAKDHSKDVVQIKYKRLMEGTKSVSECQEILWVAKSDFLAVFGKFITKERLTEKEKTIYRYYCEALLVLKHYQRPGAVEGMTANEWVNRKPEKHRVMVGVHQHKTATMQVCSFALTQEEEAWFQGYYEHIRPYHLGEDSEKFFISSNGRRIHSVTNDLNRLHVHYHIKPSCSQEVRRAIETLAGQQLDRSGKEKVSHYLAHSTSVAEQHYRMRVSQGVVEIADVLDEIAGFTQPKPPESGPSATDTKSLWSDFDAFVKAFPVTRLAQPPTKKMRMEAGFSEDRTNYDKWRKQQYEQREQYLLSYYTARKPDAAKLKKLIDHEGFAGNCPLPKDIISKWKPASKTSIETDTKVKEKVKKQTWSGLVLKDFGEKGIGVVASRHFTKGDIVCDYHGKLITAAEGRMKMQDPDSEPTYLFFFKQHCIDAESPRCECHPEKDTFGRRINHSRKRANLKPQHCELKGKRVKHVILFKASKDIAVDQELLFDYGVNRRSFRGEGLDLEWLDD
ncbi:uncharacterized protein LOC144004069 [Festucalex cinctus]